MRPVQRISLIDGLVKSQYATLVINLSGFPPSDLTQGPFIGGGVEVHTRIEARECQFMQKYLIHLTSPFRDTRFQAINLAWLSWFYMKHFCWTSDQLKTIQPTQVHGETWMCQVSIKCRVNLINNTCYYTLLNYSFQGRKEKRSS